VTEFVVRASAPSLIVIVEKEGPTRVVSTAVGEADAESLESWLAASPVRAALVAVALADRSATGGIARGRSWGRELSREPGIVAQLAELLVELRAAEAALGDVAGSAQERLSDVASVETASDAS
jgi:hypothetical protein